MSFVPRAWVVALVVALASLEGPYRLSERTGSP
jgi:hypothetical protein